MPLQGEKSLKLLLIIEPPHTTSNKNPRHKRGFNLRHPSPDIHQQPPSSYLTTLQLLTIIQVILKGSRRKQLPLKHSLSNKPHLPRTTMNTQTFAQAQNIAPITDEQLIAVNGGGLFGDIVDLSVGFIPYAGTANTIAGFAGGPTVGSAVEGLFS